MYITVQIFISSFLFNKLIYDYKDCGGSFGLISLQPQNLPEEEKTAFENIGVEVPSMM